MKIKTFHIRLTKEHLQADEEALNAFLEGKEIVNTYSELIKTEKVNFWTILISYNEMAQVAETPIQYSTNSELTESEQNLYENLKKWRQNQAEQEQVNPFLIAQNRDLIILIKNKVSNLEDMKKLGWGEKRLAKYGHLILKIILEK